MLLSTKKKNTLRNFTPASSESCLNNGSGKLSMCPWLGCDPCLNTLLLRMSGRTVICNGVNEKSIVSNNYVKLPHIRVQGG